MLKQPDKPGKFNYKWDGPFTIIRRTSEVNYQIQNDKNQKIELVHCNRLKKIQAERKLYSDKQVELVNKTVNNNRTLKYTNSKDKYSINKYPKRNINWKIET